MIKKLLLFIKDIIIFIGFWGLAIIISIILSFYIHEYNMVNLIAYSLLLILLFIIYYKDFLFFINDFKQNYKKYIPKYLMIGFFGILLMNVSSILISNVVGNLPENEEAVRSTLGGAKIIILILNLGLVTPICEEVIFRLNFKNLFKNKYVFSIITGLLFSSMHMFGSQNFIEILYIIPYFIMGFILSYIYYDSNNLFNSIMVHMFNNILTLLLLLEAGI